jgi:hypothetical protein
MKAAKVLGGLVLGCMALGVACSSDEHQLGAEQALQAPYRCEDIGKEEGMSIGAYCTEFTYESCPNGAWADTRRWSCGGDVTLGCCMPNHFGVRASCHNPQGYRGVCLPYSPEGCQDGRWLPKSITDCAEGQGCCAPRPEDGGL